MIAQAAKTLGKANDTARYATLADDIAAAFNAEWFNPATGNYADGFQHVRIEPNTFEGLTSASGWIRTPRGPLRSSWNRYQPHGRFDVEIPVGVTATLCLPTLGFETFRVEENAQPIWEDGSLVREAQGVADVTVADQRVTINIGSGQYAFRIVRVA